MNHLFPDMDDATHILDAVAILLNPENLTECVLCDCFYPVTLYTNGACAECNAENRSKYSPCTHPAKALHTCSAEGCAHPVTALEPGRVFGPFGIRK